MIQSKGTRARPLVLVLLDWQLGKVTALKHSDPSSSLFSAVVDGAGGNMGGQDLQACPPPLRCQACGTVHRSGSGCADMAQRV
jgi:hypothetical protein